MSNAGDSEVADGEQHMSRDHILVVFQMATNRDNITECIDCLEKCDWDLTRALELFGEHAAPANPAAAAASAQAGASADPVQGMAQVLPIDDFDLEPADNAFQPLLASKRHVAFQPPEYKRPALHANNVDMNQSDVPAAREDEESACGVSDAESEPELSVAPADLRDDDGEDSSHSATLSDEAPLVPEGWSAVDEALHNFVSVFESRYGGMRPNFVTVSLDCALQRSVMAEEEPRPLLIYIHDDSAVASNVFCSQVLCSEELVQLIHRQFVIWPWDITRAENRDKLVQWITRSFGAEDADSLTHGLLRRFGSPMLLTIGRARTRPCVLTCNRGTHNAQEVMQSLLSALDQFRHDVDALNADRVARERREGEKREQHFAYEEAQAAEAQRDADRRREQKAADEKRLAEQARADVEQERRSNLAAALPAEPSEGCKEPTTTIRFRLPPGRAPLQRRFRLAEPLAVLLNYLDSEGFDRSHYAVLAAGPKRDLTADAANDSRTLEALGLSAREQLYVELK